MDRSVPGMVYASTFKLYEYMNLLFSKRSVFIDKGYDAKEIEEEICWVQREVQNRGHE